MTKTFREVMTMKILFTNFNSSKQPTEEEIRGFLKKQHITAAEVTVTRNTVLQRTVHVQRCVEDKRKNRAFVLWGDDLKI